jgi:uncharacterized protein (TIGR00106 family)
MSVLVEFSVVPVDKGESLSGFIARALKIVVESGVPYRINPMGTVLEGDWDQVMAVVKKCHQEIGKDAARVLTTIKIDDRAGGEGRLNKKIEAVERAIGRKLNQ